MGFGTSQFAPGRELSCPTLVAHVLLSSVVPPFLDSARLRLPGSPRCFSGSGSRGSCIRPTLDRRGRPGTRRRRWGVDRSPRSFLYVTVLNNCETVRAGLLRHIVGRSDNRDLTALGFSPVLAWQTASPWLFRIESRRLRDAPPEFTAATAASSFDLILIRTSAGYVSGARSPYTNPSGSTAHHTDPVGSASPRDPHGLGATSHPPAPPCRISE